MVDEEFIDMIKKYCPNIQYIDIKDSYTFNKITIDRVKPIFNLLRTFNCSLSGMTNEDSKYLFSLNKKLEYLVIDCDKYSTGRFLDVLPGETLRELILSVKTSISISFDKICNVSIINFYSTP